MSHSADLHFEEKAVSCAMEFTAEPFQSENMGCVLRPNNNSNPCVCKTPLHRTVSSAAPILTASHIMVAVSTGIFTGMIASITSPRTAQPSAALRCRVAPPIDNTRKTRKARRQQSATRMRYPPGAAPEVPARCGHLSALPPANVPTLYRSAQSSGHPPVDATLWVRISSHASASPALCARPRHVQISANQGLGTPGRFHLGELLWHSSKELHRIRCIVYHTGECRWTCSWIRSDVFGVQVVHAATARSGFALAHSMQTRVADVSWCAWRTTAPEPAIEPKTASRKKGLFSSASRHVLPRSLLYCIRVVFEIPSCPCTLKMEDRCTRRTC